MAHNLARWTTRVGLGEQLATTKTLRRRFFALAGRLTGSARRLTLHLPQRWPWQNQFSSALARLRAATPFLTVAPATGPPPPQSSASQSKVSPTRAAHLGQRGLLTAFGCSIRGSLRRQPAHYRRHPPGIRRDAPLSIPVMSPSTAHTTPFGGLGIRERRVWRQAKLDFTHNLEKV